MLSDKEIQRLSFKLCRDFDLINSGNGVSRYPNLGRGAEFRRMRYGENARFIHDRATALSGTGEIFVSQTPSTYARRGLVLMDHSTNDRWGGNQALCTQQDLMRDLTRLIVLLSAMKNKVGAVVPTAKGLRLYRPGTTQPKTIASRITALVPDKPFSEQTKLLRGQARDLQYAVLIVSVRSLLDPQVQEDLKFISEHCELVIIEVSDTWDWHYPEVTFPGGKPGRFIRRVVQNFQVDGKVVPIDINDQDQRAGYEAECNNREKNIREFVEGLKGARRYAFSTAFSLERQALFTFASDPRRRTA
jgi:hypothetical protein